MDKTVIGLLHPGEMGAAVGACLSQRGLTVVWASAGRGADTAARAAAAGMRDAGTAGEMAEMAYAAWTKGTAALILAIRALARAEGVEETLLAEWQLSQPSLAGRSHRAARSATEKGWRWVAEMEEIAATMAAAGLPPGFHQAAAAIYSRVPHATTPPANELPLKTVIAALVQAADQQPVRRSDK